MVHLRDIQGRVCTLMSNSECLDLNIHPPALPKVVRGPMVLVVGGVPERADHVKVMTITSTLKDSGDYVPISPTPKQGYAIQLRFRNYPVWHYREVLRSIPTLPKYSYLKIDACYEVPVQMLVNAVDCLGNPFMIWCKHHGGLKELQEYVRRRDLIRRQEFYRA